METPAFPANLPPHLFWDVDPAGLHPESHAGFIIPRVLDRGSGDDVSAVLAHYGRDRVLQALLEAPVLHPKTRVYFATVWNVPRERFRSHHTQGKEFWCA